MCYRITEINTWHSTIGFGSLPATYESPKSDITNLSYEVLLQLAFECLNIEQMLINLISRPVPSDGADYLHWGGKWLRRCMPVVICFLKPGATDERLRG